MKERVIKILFSTMITITLFSLWAAFALLVVNQKLYKDLPGYTKGRLCIWELVAFIAAIFMTNFIIKKWGNIQLQKIDGEKLLTMNPNYGIFFGAYFLIAFIIGIWQFWIFSQNF